MFNLANGISIFLLFCLGGLVLLALIYLGVRALRTNDKPLQPPPSEIESIGPAETGEGTYQAPTDQSISGYDLEDEPGHDPDKGYNMPPEEIRQGKLQEGDNNTGSK